ncbi:U3 snoRNA-associated small subunit rRNA processing protein, putative [Plasmodium gallinaceum]|uniref:U3 snoRNA-associated small subunit rRNA processing protein, putative n=1 Tax=Plasmodium gallinaceum TaxID=5849 RepID=A0A1J1GP53_PLAGA|nr:U3 snoRNA-associated small subunit rRNA processing protein, putative [Plasmodium gallinaceum]CRG94189.1 U3 snoRNA-associated small subunit rRNA processing protein, putative [Plasmodium gallinaceum]
MSVITNIEIEKKFFDFYDGDDNVFYSKEYELFLSLCNSNIYAFKVENNNNYNIFKFNILYPTCVLESCVDIDDVKEFYHKKYLNKYCISLFSSIRLFYYSNKNIFLSTDDNNIHHYVLMLNDEIQEDYKNENKEIEREEKDIYLYDHKENEEKHLYSYSYNWVYLKKVKIWKSLNIVISCFHFNEVEYKKLVVGYNNGLINVYNLDTYKLKISYKIHNSRITSLKMYKNFILSSDITKNIFIYDSVKGEKIISCEDHMSGINDFLFLAIQNDSIKEKKNDENVKNGEVEDIKNEEDEKLIGFISIGNDKIMNIWNLNMLNSNEEEIENLTKKNKNNKKNKKNKNSNLITFNPIKQIYLSSDINSAIIIPSSIFKNKKSKITINDENIKWLILTHDDKGNLLFYNPLKGDIIYKFKENKMLINESNIKKFFLLKNELYIFRVDSSILIYDIRNFKLINNYICKLEGMFEILFFDPSYNEALDENYKSENEEIIDKKYDYKNKKKNAVALIGDNIIRILKFENIISQTLLIGHEDVVSCIKLNEKNNLLFSASTDKNIFVWNLKSNECLYILKDNLYPINSIDVNLKKFPLIVLVSVCEDNSLKLWKFTIELDNIKNNKKKRKFDENFNEKKQIIQSSLTIYPHKLLINDVALSPNSKVIATCSKDKTIKLFETKNLKLIKTLDGHKKSVQNIFFSKNENILYSNSYDCIRVWNLSNYTCVKSIQSFDFNITRILILNDNCMINGYSNGNISIINIKNCEKLLTTNYHKDKIFCLKNYDNSIVSASINGELIFFKNTSEEIVTENIYEKRKNIFYENCLENLLKEKKINESLLICLKLDKKFKFKSIIENYLNYYTFSILNILKKFEYEYGIKKINEKNIVKKEKNDESIYSLNQSLINPESKNSEKQTSNVIWNENNDKNLNDDNFVSNIQNYIENSDILENYVYNELSKLSSKNESKDLKKEENTQKEKIKEENEDKKSNIFINQLDDDNNFVLFLKKIKEKSEHSYFLYLNKLMEYITFFVMNHRYAYISNFLLNSLIKYIDYSDICKINNYQHFFEIYNSYIPRHKNRYLKSLQKSKCFELININYYKGDIKMMS